MSAIDDASEPTSVSVLSSYNSMDEVNAQTLSFAECRIHLEAAVRASNEGGYLKDPLYSSALVILGSTAESAGRARDIVDAMMTANKAERTGGNLRYLACVILRALYFRGCAVRNDIVAKGRTFVVDCLPAFEGLGELKLPRRRSTVSGDARTREIHEQNMWFEASCIFGVMVAFFGGGVRSAQDPQLPADKLGQLAAFSTQNLKFLKKHNFKRHQTTITEAADRRLTKQKREDRKRAEGAERAVAPEVAAALSGTPGAGGATVDAAPADYAAMFPDAMFVEGTRPSDSEPEEDTDDEDGEEKDKPERPRRGGKAAELVSMLSALIKQELRDDKKRKKHRSEREDDDGSESDGKEQNVGQKRRKFIEEEWKRRGYSQALIRLGLEILACLPTTKDHSIAPAIARALAMMKKPWIHPPLVTFVNTLKLAQLHVLNKIRLRVLKEATKDGLGLASALSNLRTMIDRCEEVSLSHS